MLNICIIVLMKYHIITFGCQMNVSDSERISAILELMNYEKTKNIEEADVIIINMCAVRQPAVDRVYGLNPKFKKLKKKNKKLKIIATGCILKPDKIKLLSFVDFIIDKKELYKLNDLLNKKVKINKNYLSIIPKYESPFVAYIPISFGCSNYCTYCAVPYTRGKLVSRDYKEILKEIKDLIQEGYKEIWLLGENVNNYHYGKMDFVKLIKEIDKIQNKFWLRFTSPHPKDFSKEMINALAKSPKITPYINLPLQSGDNQVLKAMNRPYTIKQYLTLVSALRKAFRVYKHEDLAISTDIIVGFPGETKDQFNNTLKAMETIKFDMAYISKYSPRPESLCFKKMEDTVLKREKKIREKALNSILSKTSLENNKKAKGKIVEVLVLEKNKEYLIGKTRDYKTIKFKGSDDLIGKFVKVKINKVRNFGFEGKLIKEKLIVILGPTASGKTDLAIKIAKKYNGELISADSKTIYKEMNIGTAKSSFPHHLINIVSLKQDFSVAMYKEKAIQAIDQIIEKRKTPILVGGTGLYIKSIVDNLDFPKVKPNLEIRKNLESKDTKELFKMYEKLDEEGSKTIDKNNKRRLVRAIEVCLLTKKPFSSQRLRQEPLYQSIQIGINITKEKLKENIKKRTNQMIQKGLEKEAKKLLSKYPNNPNLNTIGYSEWKKQGNIKEEINSNTFKFAKRQMTWFKKDKTIKWVKTTKEALAYLKMIDNKKS